MAGKTMRMLMLAALLCVVGSQAAESKQAKDKTSLAVLDLEAAAGYSGLASRFGDALNAAFLADSELRVVERRRIVEAIREQGLGQTGAIREDTAVELGELIGAQHLIVGSLAALGETLRVDARRLNARTGELVAAAHVEFSTSSIDLAARSLADKLSGLTPAELSDEALQRASRELARALEKRLPRAQGQIVKIEDLGWAEINVGSENGSFPGLRLVVMGRGLGGGPERRGIMLVREVQQRRSAGPSRTESFPIQTGDTIEPLPAAFSLEAPEANIEKAIRSALSGITHLDFGEQDRNSLPLLKGIVEIRGQVLGARRLVLRVMDQNNSLLFEVEGSASL